MIRAPLSTTSVLDESAEVVRATATPWAALLIATTIPYRLMQAIFVDHLIELGSDASSYAHFLQRTANYTCLAFVVALWGRAVFARACRLATARGGAAGAQALRVPPTAFASFVFVSSIAQLLSYLLLPTVLGLLLGVTMSGLAVGTMELNDVAGIRAALRRLFRFGKEARVVMALVLVFSVGFIVALLNVAMVFEVGFSLASTVGGWDAPRWHLLLTSANRRYTLMIIAGALVTLEPFWVAANVTLVQKAGVAESGDDLKLWFEELQTS